MSPTKRRLFDLEIDEISVVERPANQHGLIAFAKSAAGVNQQEDQMPFFDSDGDEVDVSVLEHGDVVFNEAGEQYVYDATAEDGDDDDVVYVDESGQEYYIEAEEPEHVGKASFGGLRNAAGAARAGFRNPTLADPFAGGAARFGQHVGRNKKAYGWGTAGVLGGTAAGGTAYGLTRKAAPSSFGDQVLQELSKAVNDDDRNKIIAKAMNEVEIMKSENAQLRSALEAEQELRIEEAYISKAAEYNLPVSPEVLGPILKSMAEVLTPEQIDVVDSLFNSVGDYLYDEVGYVGDTDNDSVLNRVDSLAGELVTKSDMTSAEAMTALFANNPAAYDAYLAENGR